MGTHKRTKFITLGVVVALLLVGTAGFTVWYAYHSAHAADTALQNANKAAAGTIPAVTPIATYEQCAKSPRGTLTQTYPPACTVKGGKTFTDNSQKYMTIKEWGVKLPMSDALKGLKYTLNPSDDNDNVIGFTFASLEGGTACGESDAAGHLVRISESNYNNWSKTDSITARPKAVHVGAYYYYAGMPQGACAENVKSAQQVQIMNARLPLSDAISKVTAL